MDHDSGEGDDAQPCIVCEAVERDGYNSTANPHWFHCRDCCAVWTGLARAHCTLCHQTFNSNGAADHHWIRDCGHTHPSNLVSGTFKYSEGIWYLSAEYNPAEIWGKGITTGPSDAAKTNSSGSVSLDFSFQ